MSARRLLLLLALSLSVVAGSYVVARRDALSRAASAPRVSAGLEEPAAPGGYGMWTTDESLAFWRERVERDPRDYLSLTFLGQAHLRKARETGEVGAYARAEAALRQALAINPHYETAQAYLSAALFVQHDFGDAKAPVFPAAGLGFALHHHRHLQRGAIDWHQVFFEIEMVGNLEEKSLVRCAILTAIWRATLL